MAHMDCSYYADSIKRNVRFLAFLPSGEMDGYPEGGSSYETLYLLHDLGGDCMDWLRETGIERYAREYHMAVIMPSGENSGFLSMKRGEDYLKYIGEDLISFTRTIFPLSCEREKTYIAGAGIGGYGAFRIGMEYPEVFGKAAGLSGIYYPDRMAGEGRAGFACIPRNYLSAVFGGQTDFHGTKDSLAELAGLRLKEGRELPRLYMSCCGSEPFCPASKELYQEMQALDISVEFERYTGAYGWKDWDQQIQRILAWLAL